MASDKIQTGLRINETAYGKLRIIAAREARSLNNLIEYVLQQYLEEYESAHGSIPISAKNEP